MRALMAIVGDTWRQSKQQVVFILMAIMLLVIAGMAIGFPKAIVAPDGTRQFGLVFSDQPTSVFSQMWVGKYRETQQTEQERRVDPNKYLKEDGTYDQKKQQEDWEKLEKAQIKAMDAATNLTEFRRSVEAWILLTVGLMFTFSMWLFIAACAGYFPDLLAAGAVDCVLAKPLSRLRIFLGKYLGGLVLFSAAIIAFCSIVYVGIGLRLGVWHLRIFYSLPLLIFTAALLYSFMALIGIITRSTPLSILLGYFLYFVVDSALRIAQQLQTNGLFKQLSWLDKPIETSRYLLPNFSVIKDTAVALVLTLPKFDWSPLLVGSSWLALSLMLAYAVFRTRDY